MTLNSIGFFVSPTLPPVSTPGGFLLSTGTTAAPMAISPGAARDLLASVGLGDGRASLFSSEIANGLAGDENSLLADAWPLDDPDTGTLIAPEELLMAVLGGFLLFSFFAIAQIKLSGGWQQWKKRQKELHAAMQVATARERLESLLKDRAMMDPHAPASQKLDIESDEEAFHVALAVLTLWQEKIASEPNVTPWEILLIFDPVMEPIAPCLRLVAMPAGKYRVNRTESILIRVGPDARHSPVEFPTVKDLMKYIEYLETLASGPAI